MLIPTGSGGLDGPAGLAITGDGNVLVASQAQRSSPGVRRPDQSVRPGGSVGLRTGRPRRHCNRQSRECASGQFLQQFRSAVWARRGFPGAFVPPGRGGLSGAEGLALGPNGNLFVSSRWTDAVLEFDGMTGAPIDHDPATPEIEAAFVTGGGLDEPTYLVFQSLPNDCNNNGTPDDCDLSTGTSRDCNANGTPDECDLSNGMFPDCNSNGIPDQCDLAEGTSRDCDQDRIPDECELPRITPGDFDGDCDVDGDDLTAFEACATGPAIPQPSPDCAWARFDSDDDVDQTDFAVFQRCFSGENNPADPNCAD